jgi:hypothetical protein
VSHAVGGFLRVFVGRGGVKLLGHGLAPLKEPNASAIGLLLGTNRVASGLIREARKNKAMANLEKGRIVETPTEARQAEPGPSVLTLLIVSLALAIIILGGVWIVFFRT